MTYLYFLPNLRSLKAFKASSEIATLYLRKTENNGFVSIWLKEKGERGVMSLDKLEAKLLSIS